MNIHLTTAYKQINQVFVWNSYNFFIGKRSSCYTLHYLSLTGISVTWLTDDIVDLRGLEDTAETGFLTGILEGRFLGGRSDETLLPGKREDR